VSRLPVFTVVDETTLTIHSSSFFEQATAEWKALLEWCQLHGLDPERMPSTGQTIVRDLARCRVVYDEYVMSADEAQLRAKYWRSFDDEPERHRVHVQGETPPLPFPDVILAHLDPPRETA
jgi:hypothetical protein